MKLSVIIPCYNEESTIETILNKVINNNYNNKEIIVIDDCSNDNSKNIIQKYKNNGITRRYKEPIKEYAPITSRGL